MSCFKEYTTNYIKKILVCGKRINHRSALEIMEFAGHLSMGLQVVL